MTYDCHSDKQPLTSLFFSVLKHAHRINAAILTIFIIVHVTTHVSGIFGIEVYNTVQSYFRVIYRHALIEPILLTSIISQLIIGAILLIRSLRQGRPSGFWAWTQILSGGYFLLFATQHLIALAEVRLFFGLDTNFYWPATVMASAPSIYYFAPYYFLGVLAILSHVAVGIRYAILDAGYPKLANRVGLSIIMGAACLSAFILPILAGAYFPIELPDPWIEYMRSYDPGFMKP